MASRAQQDSFIDDSDEQCPLCVEEFDLSDKNFRPCPCGYQVCQFCFNNIRTNMNGLCPACRRPYDEKTIEFKTVSPEEFKADMALKARKQVAAKQKEAEKRQNETLSRKNLAGLRVVQKNLVYVVGLNLNPRQKEDDLLKILRGPEYFGQYGKIIKIVVSKAKEGATSNSIGVYVTFARKEDAELCISAVDGTTNVDRILRAQYGTTKYCSAFLRNEQCNNRSCMFLHETGEDSDSFSRQDLSSLNATQRPSQPGPSQPAQSQPQGTPQQAPQTVASASQPMHRQGSKDETGSRSGSTDASALPSSASWANKDSHINLNRRTSLAASRSSPSPRTGNASIASQKSEEPKREEPSSRAKEKQPAQPPNPPSESVPSQTSSRKSSIEEINDTAISLLNRLIKDITSPNFKFIFSSSVLTADELRAIENHPCLIDVYGGMKRRLKREKEESTRVKEEEERAKQEAEAQNIQQATAMVEDENMEGGSLQLGGEPEETHDTRRPTGRISEPQSAISPPSQQGLVGSPLSLNQNFSSLTINGRSLTPQQLMLLKANNAPSGAGLMDQFQSFGGNAFDHGESNRGLFQHQMPQVSAQGHARHSSRFSFAGDSGNKNTNARVLGHQSSMMQSNPLSAASTQNPLANHPYSSGIQHPPPGLKTAGTPPISGGGMFGQGHGFTSASNPLGMGGNFNNKDSDADLMREFQHGRGNVGGHGIGQSHETSKREYNFPSSYRFPSPSSTQAPALGLLGSYHDVQHGPYHELGQLKQKKKGKKHRHANTSSFGGGVVDHADPSILRARNHQGGAGAGQGLYGGQGQVVDADFPPLVPPSKPPVSRMRDILVATPHSRLSSLETGRSTPPVPPGLGLSHGHPSPGSVGESRPTSRSATPAQNKKGITSSSVAPAVPILPLEAARSSTLVKSSNGLESKSSTVAGGKEEDKEPSGLLSSGDQGAVSLGSPKAKSFVLSRDEKSLEVRGSQEHRKPSKEIAPAPTPKKPAAAERPAEGQQSKPVPTKLKIPSGVSIGDNFGSKESKAGQLSSSKNGVVASQSCSDASTLSGPNSRPETPATANSRISDSPAPRQPRTIRVLPTSKAETVPPLPPSASLPSATQATAPPVLSKQRSRQPSLTSMSGPATPVGELVSDNMSATSASLSRPSSPPPGSKIGSAPVRHMTKSQAKKERQAKAKQAAEEAAKKTEDDSAKAEAEEVVQAPIIGRQKKKRRPLTGTSATEEFTPDASRPSSPPPAAGEPASSAKVGNDEDTVKSPLAREPTPPPPSPPKTSPIIQEPTEPVPRDYNAPLRTFPLNMAQETKSAAQLIQEMIAEGLISKDHSFFKSPPSLSHRYDVGPGDFEEAQAAANAPLTVEQKQALRDGKPVRIRTETGKQMGRVLITPKGAVLRGFSDEDEEHALTLEKSILEVPSLEAFHPAPSSRLSGAPSASSMPFSSSIFPSDDNFSLNNVGYSFGLRESASGVPNLAFGLYDNDGMFSPTADEGALAKTVEETRANWEAAKKETEALQKRLDALMKKNRRLAGLV